MAQEENVDPKNDEQYRNKLTPMQYEVTRNKATERAFTGKYWNTFDDGKYLCVCCGAELFSSDSKFDSMCGWPSFYAPIVEEQIEEETDLAKDCSGLSADLNIGRSSSRSFLRS